MVAWAQLWQHLRGQAAQASAGGRPIPDALWQLTLSNYGFLQHLSTAEQNQLRLLSGHFLAHKEFHGAQGLVVTDAMAVAVAAQACLLLLHWGPPAQALRWYDDFVGIVLHPGEVLARREAIDEAGVVHHYHESLSGEAMQSGPVMLSWHDVASAGASAVDGYNVVVHEFAHKLDMQGGEPDGCPPLPAGFLGHRSSRAAQAAWRAVLEPAYASFRERVIIAERFGGDPPWLDPYGAESLSEFFAVACEAYFVNRPRFGQEWPTLLGLLDAFFRPALPETHQIR